MAVRAGGGGNSGRSVSTASKQYRLKLAESTYIADGMRKWLFEPACRFDVLPLGSCHGAFFGNLALCGCRI